MVTLQTADNALKSFYLDAVTDALDMKTNPFLAQIQRTSADVAGKDVRKVIRIGVSGGISAGSETGDLPKASLNDYAQFQAELRNLYGTIEISDKAIRASANNEGAFVNLLNDEMQSLIKSASFNFGRMLFGDGSGRIARVKAMGTVNNITLDSVSGIVEGMIVDFCTASGEEISAAKGRKVAAVDRAEKTIKIEGTILSATVIPVGSGVYVQGSKNNEITGLGALFSDKELYGMDRGYSVMRPYIATDLDDITENMIQTAIDTIEENSGSKVNFILCSWGVRRALIEHFKQYNCILSTVQLEGGFMAISYNGIPIVADRFCPEGTMYLLNTNDFKLHQLCDWQWLEGEGGKILKQVAGKPVYTATLVKYAELICERPSGQGMLTGITEY